MKCRHCQTLLEHLCLDLGFAPPSNAYLSQEDLQSPELTFPLRLYVCHKCWLVQTQDFARADELFQSDYAYFSSASQSWLAHARNYCDDITRKLSLNRDSLVIEVASNDGYLLKNFVASNIPCLGIEPTKGTAGAARKLDIPVLEEFFGESLGHRLISDNKSADLIIGNNVYAHVPDINDFTKGLKIALKPSGTITLEFPHLLELIKHNQFDTVYHEHFSYLSLYTVSRIFNAHGLRIYDVEQLPTHGGSLRIYGCHIDDLRPTSDAVTEILKLETDARLQTSAPYNDLQDRANKAKDDFVSFLIEQKRQNRKIAGYGAAAKGNTLLNFAGIKPDLLPYVCDAAPSKQGKCLPGSHIPILPPTAMNNDCPDIVVIFPWNIATEVKSQLNKSLPRKVKFATAIPSLKVEE